MRLQRESDKAQPELGGYWNVKDKQLQNNSKYSRYKYLPASSIRTQAYTISTILYFHPLALTLFMTSPNSML